MARDRSKKEPTAGMRKAVAKAEKLSNEPSKEVLGGAGELSVGTQHFSNTYGDRDRPRPVVQAIANNTGEIRSYPTYGSNRRFAKSVVEAESRGKAFIQAATNGDEGKLRGLRT